MGNATTTNNKVSKKDLRPHHNGFIYALIGILSAADSIYIWGIALFIPILLGLTIIATPLLLVGTLVGLALTTGLIFFVKTYDEYLRRQTLADEINALTKAVNKLLNHLDDPLISERIKNDQIFKLANKLVKEQPNDQEKEQKLAAILEKLHGYCSVHSEDRTSFRKALIETIESANFSKKNVVFTNKTSVEVIPRTSQFRSKVSWLRDKTSIIRDSILEIKFGEAFLNGIKYIRENKGKTAFRAAGVFTAAVTSFMLGGWVAVAACLLLGAGLIVASTIVGANETKLQTKASQIKTEKHAIRETNKFFKATHQAALINQEQAKKIRGLEAQNAQLTLQISAENLKEARDILNMDDAGNLATQESAPPKKSSNSDIPTFTASHASNSEPKLCTHKQNKAFRETTSVEVQSLLQNSAFKPPFSAQNINKNLQTLGKGLDDPGYENPFN